MICHMKWGGWQFELHWRSPSRVNCDSQRARAERGAQRLKKKPVSLSVSEVKWMCNLLSRETRRKQKSCVCVVVDCES